MQDDQRKAIEALKQSFREDQARAATAPKTRLFDVIEPFLLPALGILGALIVIVPIGYALLHLIDGGNFNSAVQGFCGADTSQRYGDAYQMLSRNLRTKVTQGQLEQATKNARLQDCAVADSGVRFDLGSGPEYATVTLVEATSDNSGIAQVSATFVLVRDGLSWKIDGIQAENFTLP